MKKHKLAENDIICMAIEACKRNQAANAQAILEEALEKPVSQEPVAGE